MSASLFKAAKTGDTSKIAAYLKKNGDPDLRDFPKNSIEQGITLLMYAVRANQLGVASLLLKSNANPNAKVTSPHESAGGQSVLDYACGSHSAEEPSIAIVELLLMHGADPNNRANNGFSTLEMSVSKNDQRIIELLVKFGAKVDPPPRTVESALQTAISSSKCEIGECLLRAGADPNYQTKNGGSALMYAVFGRSRKTYAMVQMLLGAGASIDLRDWQGRTALSFAAEEAGRCYDAKIGDEIWMPIIKLLVEKGANPSTKDSNGMSPIDWATLNRMADDPERSRLFFDKAAVYLRSMAAN